jgi:1-hydroxycarotenoid 3,4-desaturase
MALATHRNSKVIVVGAGMAGLACAISLAAAGHRVLLLERSHAPGGKMRLVEADGAAMDGGPTVFTMRHVFQELFARAGARLEDHVRLKQASILARHYWPGSEALDLHADREASAEAIRAFAGEREAEGFRRFCRDAGQIYDTLKGSFIAGQRPSPVELAWRVGRQNPAGMLRMKPFSTLWGALGSYFADIRLRQLFGRYATYVGSSPFLAPATLMLIAHVEQEGVWLVDGGMHALALALAGLAEQMGVEIRYGAEVSRIERSGGRFAVAYGTGDVDTASDVVWCGDVSALASGIASGLPRAIRPVTGRNRSLSAIVWAMRATASGRPLARHTVLFSDDYPAEFDAILGRRQVPQKPTVYLCAHDRDDGGARDGEGPERLYLLVNAPADGDLGSFAESGMHQCLENTWQQLERCGLSLAPHGAITETGPREWNTLFPATGGALYGRASHGWTASFARPGARTGLPGLYLAGGSVHPGAGVPMAAMSGILAAECLLRDHPST